MACTVEQDIACYQEELFYLQVCLGEAEGEDDRQMILEDIRETRKIIRGLEVELEFPEE